ADDGELDARLVAHHAHEVAAVLGLAHGAGGDGDEGVDAGALGLAAKATDAVGGAGEGIGGDHALEGRVAEADHVLGAIEGVDLTVGADPGDEQVDGVGADVEGRDLHGRGTARAPLATAPPWGPPPPATTPLSVDRAKKLRPLPCFPRA